MVKATQVKQIFSVKNIKQSFYQYEKSITEANIIFDRNVIVTVNQLQKFINIYKSDKIINLKNI